MRTETNCLGGTRSSFRALGGRKEHICHFNWPLLSLLLLAHRKAVSKSSVTVLNAPSEIQQAGVEPSTC